MIRFSKRVKYITAWRIYNIKAGINRSLTSIPAALIQSWLHLNEGLVVMFMGVDKRLLITRDEKLEKKLPVSGGP